jgi:type I restriction enzyme M protein
MLTQQQLGTYLFGAADILRGHIDAADFKQYIFPLVFYKRLCDVWDEETAEGLDFYEGDLEYAEKVYPHQFTIPHEYHWREVRNATKNVGLKLQQCFIGIENANNKKENKNSNLVGIFNTFGDTQWTNAQKFSDKAIKDLIEHFSKETLSTQNVPADVMGSGYEYLIKKFADDGGHTAAEFYTNRTVVRLMTMLVEPKHNETVYDPTCGSGGMLLECVEYLKRQQKTEYHTLRLFGQEKNIITSAIARINMILHNIAEFEIMQWDTLDDPKFIENDELKQFDIILANPPYSIKKWNQKAFVHDKRNLYGTPPQGCADYAFQQHILASLTEKGRCAVLWPHGVLFRDSEAEIRKKMIENDWVEAVIGLGANLFYNSSMESCIVVCRKNKPAYSKGKTIFINAVSEIEKIRATSNLREEHIDTIYHAFKHFIDVEGFAKVATIDDILANNGNLSIPLYVVPKQAIQGKTVSELFTNLQESNATFEQGMNTLLQELKNAGI